MFLERDAQDMAIFTAASKALGIEPEIVISQKNIGTLVKDQRPAAVFINCRYFGVGVVMDIKEASPDSMIVLVDGNKSQEISAKEFGTFLMLSKNRVMTKLKMVRRCFLPLDHELFSQRLSTGKRPKERGSIFKAMFVGKNCEDLLIFNAAADVLAVGPRAVMCEETALGTAKKWQPNIIFVDCFHFHPRIIMDMKDICPNAIMIAVDCIGEKKSLAMEFGAVATLETHSIIGMLKMIRRQIASGEAVFD